MSLMFVLEIVLWLGAVYFGLLALVASVLQAHGSFFAKDVYSKVVAKLGYKWKRQLFYTACMLVPLALINGWLVWDLF